MAQVYDHFFWIPWPPAVSLALCGILGLQQADMSCFQTCTGLHRSSEFSPEEEVYVWMQISEWEAPDYLRTFSVRPPSMKSVARQENRVIPATKLIGHLLPPPAAPGCSTSHLNNAEDLLRLWTPLCREPPTVVLLLCAGLLLCLQWLRGN